jgi:NAD-dependent SIR2 family protein deacetylase
LVIELRIKKNEWNNNIFVGYGKDEDFKCSQCFKEIEEGFICENNNQLVLCPECQDKFEMHKCRHDKEQIHKHLKFTKGKESE